jgi:hypothetical protein
MAASAGRSVILIGMEPSDEPQPAAEPDPDGAPSPEDKPHLETQEERATRSLMAILGGADLTAETMQLANEFTDRQTGRFSRWLHRRGGDA